MLACLVARVLAYNAVVRTCGWLMLARNSVLLRHGPWRAALLGVHSGATHVGTPHSHSRQAAAEDDGIM
jgi:hypothetical protein